jgi:hypothetical protein
MRVRNKLLGKGSRDGDRSSNGEPPKKRKKQA